MGQHRIGLSVLRSGQDPLDFVSRLPSTARSSAWFWTSRSTVCAFRHSNPTRHLRYRRNQGPCPKDRSSIPSPNITLDSQMVVDAGRRLAWQYVRLMKGYRCLDCCTLIEFEERSSYFNSGFCEFCRPRHPKNQWPRLSY